MKAQLYSVFYIWINIRSSMFRFFWKTDLFKTWRFYTSLHSTLQCIEFNFKTKNKWKTLQKAKKSLKEI